MSPIFFAWTRSFWAGAVSIIMAISMMDPTILHAAVISILWLFQMSSVSASAVADKVVALAPVISMLGTGVVLQQRSGAARPYTVKATKETLR